MLPPPTGAGVQGGPLRRQPRRPLRTQSDLTGKDVDDAIRTPTAAEQYDESVGYNRIATTVFGSKALLFADVFALKVS